MEHQVMEHKVLNIAYSRDGWARHLQLELDQASKEGWTPVLYSDGGGSATVILSRPERVSP